MKLFWLLPLACTLSLPAYGQTTYGQTTPPSRASSGNTVLFSRHDAPVNTPTNAPSVSASQAGANHAAATSANATITVTNTERASLTFLSYDAEVHLVPSKYSLSARTQMTVRNDSPQPLHRIALQISSALAWYSIHADGKSVPFVVHSIDSDIDHTGKLEEAVLTLPQPLAAGATLSLDTIYSGDIDRSAERLLRMGAPQDVALSADWDRIASGFTGLRGFGNVIWFPVSTQPALLGEGARVFDTIGQWKLRQSSARVRLHLLVEYRGQAPNVAILNGRVVQPDTLPDAHSNTHSAASTSAPTTPTGVLRVASFTLRSEPLGFHSFGLFVLTRNTIAARGITIYALPGDAGDATNYQQAAELVRPTVEQWLGSQQKRPVVLVDLPESDDLPYEDRNVLYLPLTKDSAKDLTPLLAHMSSHAYFISPRIWLDEGVAQFMTTLWTEHVAGRDTAIEQLDSYRAALALAEPAKPGMGVGQSLVEAYSDVYYRDKATFVLWMLRDLVGDGALGIALRSYNPALDHEPSYFQRRVEDASHHKDEEWFFDDWIYRDQGLPDLKIASIYSRPLLHGNVKNYLVSVDVANEGYCAAEVPVEVQAGASDQTSRLKIPAQSKAAVRILMPNPPDTVIVNDGTVPEVTTRTHRQAVKDSQKTP